MLQTLDKHPNYLITANTIFYIYCYVSRLQCNCCDDQNLLKRANHSKQLCSHFQCQFLYFFLQNSDSTSQHSGTQSNSIPGSSVKSPIYSNQRTSVNSLPKNDGSAQECQLCYNNGSAEDFYTLSICKHVACRDCLESYLIIEITESRTDIGLFEL